MKFRLCNLMLPCTFLESPGSTDCWYVFGLLWPRQSLTYIWLKHDVIYPISTIIWIFPPVLTSPFYASSSEYRKHYQAMKGDRLPPTWLANFEKVTIDGAKRWAGTFKFYPSLRVPRIRNASVQEAQRQPQLCLQAFFCTMCVNNCISSRSCHGYNRSAL